jgi:hypothetical protein
MLRSFALIIAALGIVGTNAFAISSAQAQSKPAQKQCYNSQTCVNNCMRNGVGRKCELWCNRQAGALPPCK